MSNAINLDGQLARIRTWQIDEARIRADFDPDGFLLLSVKLADSMHDECDLKLDTINTEKLCTWLWHRLDERRPKFDPLAFRPLTDEEIKQWDKVLPADWGKSKQ